MQTSLDHIKKLPQTVISTHNIVLKVQDMKHNDDVISQVINTKSISRDNMDIRDETKHIIKYMHKSSNINFL